MKKTLLLFSILLISYGIYTGEMGIVLTKAANICMECIGIG
ncbi:CD1871A family CXXC motif-containing protein [Peptoniphilus stercorisuis]|uniref:Thioredoxin n=1 Tax=Peptoniphilus stercorisuis TaxID=1436965 RepID=A0ABS4K9W5_9FIRM|nr:CD1871A family CXXC motif-containing protein [Peptoniphilus stercorisuis]MBP2024567.1 hypothetical protein [Peptoniphilus stercorisuis]